MNVVLIDNYDSFTFNLYHLASQVFGPCVRVLKNDAPWETISSADAVIISPGPGRPDRAADFGISQRVIQELRAPRLGVCLGHQGICTAFGGAVVPAPQPVHGRLSSVFHDGSDLFRDIPNPFQAVRYHSLMCSRPLPPSLRESAWTADGVLMAVEHRSQPVWGVQFHPESISTENGRTLLENFARQARKYVSAIPAVQEGRAGPPAPSKVKRTAFVQTFLPRCGTPRLFEQLFSRKTHAFWLDSSLPAAESGRFSFMGGYDSADAETIRYSVAGQLLSVQRGSEVSTTSTDLFDYLRERIAAVTVDGPELPFEFRGGFAGYFGYELKGLCGGKAAHASQHPDAYLVAVDRFLAIDHVTGQGFLVYIGKPGSMREAREEAHAWFAEIQTGMDLCREQAGAAPDSQESRAFAPAQSRAGYLRCIGQALAAIRQGESYEVCLTNHLRSTLSVDPLTYYQVLRRRNPAPYSAFLRYPELAIACSSPERFLKVTAQGIAESKPIKGTSPRAAGPTEDERLKRALEADEKNCSENLMIVDLLRNDLGRVCRIGSVTVPALMQVESYATVHQLVSTIRGRLLPDQTAVDCIRAAFPAGSMTGAPKIRTMEILDSLEGEARGIYSGALGYLSFGGAADLNVIIRTAVFSADQVSIGCGSAIVALSHPEEEWKESLLKARALLAAFAELAGNRELVDTVPSGSG